MKKKFAFLLMGEHYDPARHCAEFETEKQITYICTVKNAEEAYAKAAALKDAGVGAIELCGAFGLAGAGRKFPRILWRAGRRGHARRGRGLRKIA